MTPVVSVVIPVKDGARDLPRLLDALAAVEWPRERLETLVVDNGSADGSRELAARAGLRVLDEPRPGPYAARNRGAHEASGEWVVFTDADCAPRPDWLRRLLADPIPDGAGAIAGEVLALELETPVQRFVEARGFMKHAVTLPHKAIPGFSTANVAIRRDALLALGGFRDDVLFFGDMELAWRLQIDGGGKLLFRPDAVVLHRHRRTARELWRQGVQHGRGVAFMKSAHPGRYRIGVGEQIARLASIGTAAGRAASGSAPDRWRAPGYLALWYGGMAWGYARGPAWVDRPTDDGRSR